MSEKLLGQIRHILTLGVGYLAGKGIITEQFGYEAIGLLLAAIPMIWSWFAKKDAPPAA